MKNFKYKAERGPSEIVQGVVAAETREDAVDKVNQLGLVPVDIYEAAGRTKAEQASDEPVKHRSAKARDLMAFYRQLGKLMRSGVPILQALYLLSSENDTRFAAGIVRELHKEVRQGNTLSSAMVKFPKVFNSFDIGMVQTGEAVGRLDEVLGRIADYRQKQQQLLSKVRGALAYPAFIVVMGIFSVSFILTNVIPRFSSFYLDLGASLDYKFSYQCERLDAELFWFSGAGSGRAGSFLFESVKKRKIPCVF